MGQPLPFLWLVSHRSNTVSTEEIVKSVLHSPVCICVGLVLVCLGVTACAVLRFPGLTPAPTSQAGGGPLLSPTVASALLTPIPSATPLPTPDPALPAPTPTFGLPLPEPTCKSAPKWGLGDVWQNEGVRARLGCPVSEQEAVPGEEVHFEHGMMLARPEARLIYVLLERREALGWGAYVDTFGQADADSMPELVPPGTREGQLPLLQPTGRCGKLWRENSWLREHLGWALGLYPDSQTEVVAPFAGAVQDFEGGVLLWNGNVCFVLRIDDMSWDMY